MDILRCFGKVRPVAKANLQNMLISFKFKKISPFTTSWCQFQSCCTNIGYQT